MRELFGSRVRPFELRSQSREGRIRLLERREARQHLLDRVPGRGSVLVDSLAVIRDQGLQCFHNRCDLDLEDLFRRSGGLELLDHPVDSFGQLVRPLFDLFDGCFELFAHLSHRTSIAFCEGDYLLMGRIQRGGEALRSFLEGLRRLQGHGFDGCAHRFPAFLRLPRDFFESFSKHLTARAAITRELHRRGVQFRPDPSSHLGQIVSYRPFDVDGVAAHLVEENPERYPGDRRGNRDAEVADHILDRGLACKLVQRNAEARKSEQEAHVVEIVACLLVMKAKPGRGERNYEIERHHRQRYERDGDGAHTVELAEPDDESAHKRHGTEQNQRAMRANKVSNVELSQHHSSPASRS